MRSAILLICFVIVVSFHFPGEMKSIKVETGDVEMHGDTIFMNIYLTASGGEICLGNGDIVWEYNPADFTEDISAGVRKTCDELRSREGDELPSQFIVEVGKKGNTGRIIANLYPSTPFNQQMFDHTVPCLQEGERTCLGGIYISGFKEGELTEENTPGIITTGPYNKSTTTIFGLKTEKPWKSYPLEETTAGI